MAQHGLLCWIWLFTSWTLVVHASTDLYSSRFTKQHLKDLRNETRALFDHAWDAYQLHAFPSDEILPQSCQPYGPDFDDVENVIRNDALGNFSVMLLDNLDSFVVFNDYEGFVASVQQVRDYVDFEQDTVVQVFETSIRALGGLLSAHLYASDANKGFQIPNYDGFLLEKAYDLGLRLLPAFQTKTGIPVPRVHLSKGVFGVPEKLQKETCTSGAVSPVLEMTLLSKLTGDLRFEMYSKETTMRLWNSRSDLDLIPMTLDPIKGIWKDGITGVGASIDSFYEYALKVSVLFNDEEFFEIWKDSYKALSIHSKSDWYFSNVETNTGYMASTWIDSLGAFFPGLLVLSGNVRDSLRSHALYLKLWDYFESIPERWHYSNAISDPIGLEWYPLRPEFIESSYHLYRATRDPIFLAIGQRVLKDLRTKFIAPCGFSGYQDIRTGAKQDRMESFVLSETLKYLYLLFDEENSLNHLDGNIIFSTEAHPLWYDEQLNPLFNGSMKRFGSDEMNQKVLSRYSKGKQDTSQESVSTIQKLLHPGKYLNSLFDCFTFKIPHNYFENSHKINEKKETSIANRVEMKLDSPYLEVQSDIYGLDQCEISPFMNSFHSTYLSWEEFSTLDKRYESRFVKPAHFGAGEPSIELESTFYTRYSTSKEMCPVYPTTDGFELLVGPKEEIRFVQLDRLEIGGNSSMAFKKSQELEKSILFPNDLWVPEFNSVRISVEKLQAGRIDNYHHLITQEYLDEILDDDDGICEVGKNMDNDVAYRIKSLNGLRVENGQIIWISPLSANGGGEISVNLQGRVCIQKIPVENMNVWYD